MYFSFIVLQMYCYCKCSVTLLHGAMGWSAVRVIVVFPDNIIDFFCLIAVFVLLN